MTYPEYILAFESILYGLIITKIIDQWNRIIQRRKEYKHYWPFYLFTVTVFLLIVFVYLANFDLVRYENQMDSYYGFLLFGVLPPTCFAFLSFQMFPHDQDKDLKHFLFTNRKLILLPSSVYFTFFTTEIAIRNGFGIEIALAAGIVLMTIMTMFVRKYRFLEAYVVLSFALTVFLMLRSV